MWSCLIRLLRNDADCVDAYPNAIGFSCVYRQGSNVFSPFADKLNVGNRLNGRAAGSLPPQGWKLLWSLRRFSRMSGDGGWRVS
jgi:hypothetical protein